MTLGYKAFSLCNGSELLTSKYGPKIVYHPGETYKIDDGVEFERGETGFHYSKKPMQCFEYYMMADNVVIYEVEILGDVIRNVVNDIIINYTNKIKILRPVNRAFCYPTKHDGDEIIRFVNGQIHSVDDEPAMVTDNNARWFEHNLPHRENDKPAIVYRDGTVGWYQKGHGKRSDDLPTKISVEMNIRVNSNKDWWRSHKIARICDAVTVKDGVCIVRSYLKRSASITLYWGVFGPRYDTERPSVIHFQDKYVIDFATRGGVKTKHFSLDDDEVKNYIVFKK